MGTTGLGVCHDNMNSTAAVVTYEHDVKRLNAKLAVFQDAPTPLTSFALGRTPLHVCPEPVSRRRR